MRLSVDDEIYRVDAVWLGPPRHTLPFRARYSAYGVGLVVFVLVQLLERRVGLGLGFVTMTVMRIDQAKVKNPNPRPTRRSSSWTRTNTTRPTPYAEYRALNGNV